MVFLTETDFNDQIKGEILDAVTGNSNTLLDSAELKAIAQMTAALNVRYDCAAIFSATGNNRNQAVVMYLVDIVLYHLHSRINPGQVPQLRNDRYTDAVKWMEMVARGQFQPDLPLPGGADEGTKLDVQYGSRAARNPYY